MLTKTEKTQTKVLFEDHPSLYLALMHHRNHLGQPLTFHDHLYLKAIYADPNPFKVVMKSTQCGVTEWLITHAQAQSGLRGRSVFYVLPTHPLKTRFVTNRWDRSVGQTSLYQRMAQISVEKKVGSGAESMSLKMVNDGIVAFVSSQSRASFTEFPADDVIIDEVDECDPDNIEMAQDRLAHSDEPSMTRVGNPTIQGLGIDDAFSRSDKRYWHVRCRHCGERQVMDWFKNVVREVDKATFVLRDEEYDRDVSRDIHIVCRKCGKPLDRFGDGEWVSTATSDVSGYQISRLFSSKVKIKAMAERFERGLVNEEIMTLFWNAGLGLPFTAAGAKITREVLLDATGKHGRGSRGKAGRCVMGVDVGTVLHVVIGQLFERPDDTPGVRIVYIGTVDELDDVLRLYDEYRCVVGVIDALPEQRMARKFAAKRRGAFRCFYGEVKTDSTREDAKVLTVYRTSALDAAKEALVTGIAILPMDAESVSGFYDQMQAATRVRETKPSGAVVYVWREGSKPDHYHHGFSYMLLARTLVISSH